ncbi:MAG: hypothetical protein AB2809_07395 [Candidatus Thiodiazotropha sp.]
MTSQLWIGLGFTAALVAFLMITYFAMDTSTPAQYNTLRFLTALCGGFAGGFLAGEALFSLNKEITGGTKLVISGTAGFALMFTIWLTYPNRERKPLEDSIQLSIPNGLTFEQAARSIIKISRGVINFDGFTSEQLSIKLPATDINAPSVKDALTQLRYQSSDLPDYLVSVEKGVYHIRIN